MMPGAGHFRIEYANNQSYEPDFVVKTRSQKLIVETKAANEIRDVLLEFYDFPAEHGKHLRTTNPIESMFATVRHRRIRSKGCLSNKTAHAEIIPSVVDRIKRSLVALKMPRAIEILDATVRRIERGEVNALEAIDALLAEELTLRENRRVKMALVMARLSAIKTLAGFDFSFQPSLDRNRIMALAELRTRHGVQARRGCTENLTSSRRPKPVAKNHRQSEIRRWNRGNLTSSQSRRLTQASVTKIQRYLRSTMLLFSSTKRRSSRSLFPARQ
jgi:IstB-like ATP binding protein/Transposase, Mutator family